MRESKYAGREAKDDIKRDPKYSKLNTNARREAEKELEKGGMVDLGETSLNEMEFFTVSVVIPKELPNGITALQRLKYEAQSLVDDSFIDEQGDTITVSFMRKSDANNFTEYARTLGIPEEYIEEPEGDIEPDTMESDEIEEFVSDSAGNEIFLEDIIEVKGKRFKIMEGEDGRAHIGTLQGRSVMPVGDRRAHVLLRNSTRIQDDDETAIRRMNVQSIGHVDDEPDMLKQYAYDIVDYGVKLYKILDKLDQMEHLVDLPNWLQANIIKARENVSKATHYLEYETRERDIDAVLSEEYYGTASQDRLKLVLIIYFVDIKKLNVPQVITQVKKKSEVLGVDYIKEEITNNSIRFIIHVPRNRDELTARYDILDRFIQLLKSFKPFISQYDGYYVGNNPRNP